MTVETVASVIAAGGAVIAVYFAGDTVREAASAREQASEHHDAQIAALSEATKAAADQYRAEMTVRRKVDLARQLDRQLRQLSRITEMVVQIRVTVVDEIRNADENWTPREGSQLPPMFVLLESAIAVLEAFGVPRPSQTAELARVGRHAGVALGWIASQAVGASLELEQVTLDLATGVTTDPLAL